MKKEIIKIEKIPAILWGEKSSNIYIYVHGKQSCKEEAQSFAEIAQRKGFQVLSFDLPEHGERIKEPFCQGSFSNEFMMNTKYFLNKC